MPFIYKIVNGKIKKKEINIELFMKYTSAAEKSKRKIEDKIFTKFSMNSEIGKIDSNSEHILSAENNKTCSKKALLTQTAVKELKKLVHTAGNRNKGKFVHHEVGGLLHGKEKNGIYYISVDKSSYMTGDENGTNVPEGKIGFHTHPAGEYIAQNVVYAWPSGDDYQAILDKMINENGVMHIVATKEGIYAVSFSPELAKTTKEHWKKILKAKKPDEYRFALPSTNNMKPSDYIQKIKDKKIFTVSFSSWENSTTVPFKFNYPKIENSCNI